MLRISVLVSGGGTNLQAILDAIDKKYIKNAEIAQVIASSSKAGALQRCKRHCIDGKVIGLENCATHVEVTKAILEELIEVKTDIVVLAGYMKILDKSIIEEYSGRIINIHPSLIPKYCGEGYYGKRVHEAVLKAKEKESGATVHIVDEGVDTGPILMQKKVPVFKDDTVEALAARVLQVEHEILVAVIKELADTF